MLLAVKSPLGGRLVASHLIKRGVNLRVEVNNL